MPRPSDDGIAAAGSAPGRARSVDPRGPARGRVRARARAAAILAAALAAVLLVAVLAASARREAVSRAERDAFQSSCEELFPGDSTEEAFDALGRDDYRPGCGRVVPCGELETGPRWGAVPAICRPDDCSLLWRHGDAACLLELDASGKYLISRDYRDYAAALEGE